MQTEINSEDRATAIRDKLASLASDLNLLKGDFEERPVAYDMIELAADNVESACRLILNAVRSL